MSNQTKTIITGRVDSFGRVSLDLIEGNPLTDCVVTTRYRNLRRGAKIEMHDAKGCPLTANIRQVGTTIHTPGNGVSDYRDLEIEA